MNKKDLRYIKTENLIKDTYLSLKTTKNVKVKDLCDKAMINKSTFYDHYETIEFLHKYVCHDFILEILNKCDKITNIKKDIGRFINKVYTLFSENKKTIEKLYDSDLYLFVNDVENEIMENFLSSITNEKNEYIIRFCIGGAFRALVFETDSQKNQQTLELVKTVLKNHL